jgi:fructokinase
LQDLLGVAIDPGAFPGERPEWLCITRGEAGASLEHRDGRAWSIPGEPVEVVDTVGAGDSFFAGLLHSLITTGDGAESLRFATERAVATLRRRGGLPES